MGEQICSYCRAPCESRFESGEFDADGPHGTIKGSLGDLDVSACCGEDIEDIEDAD